MFRLVPAYVDGFVFTCLYHHSCDRPNRSHTGSDGSTIAERIARAGINAQRTSEVLGGVMFPNNWNLEHAATHWRNSPAHRAALMRPDLYYAGVGVAFAGYPARTGDMINLYEILHEQQSAWVSFAIGIKLSDSIDPLH